MKKFKKLIPALCMLLVSAVMLGSTTFAWFSMNNQVSVNELSVTAKSNSQYLVINGTTFDNAAADNITAINGVDATADANNAADKKVYPVAKATKAIAGTDVGDKDWYTANSKLFNDSADLSTGTNTNAINVKKVAAATEYDKLVKTEVGGKTYNYALRYTFYIGLAKDSQDYTGKLKVTAAGTGFGSADNGFTAIVKVGTQDEMVFTAAGDNESITDITLTTTGTLVTVILYIDGNAENVKSSTTTAIAGTLNLSFTATGITIG